MRFFSHRHGRMPLLVVACSGIMQLAHLVHLAWTILYRNGLSVSFEYCY